MKRYRLGLFSLVFVVLPAALCPSFAQAAVERKKFSADGRYLIIEFLDDDLVHIEVSAVGEGPDASEMLYASPMVHKRDYEGPELYADLGNVLETQEIRLEVDLSTLAITVRDKTRSNALLTSLSPEDLDNAFKKIRITRGSIEHVYGLGQQFKIRGSSDGDWTQLGVREGEAFGNGFVGFQQAAVGNVQIPVMYAVGDNDLNYAMFLDNPYKQRWDFTAPSWNVQMFGDQIRFYLMTGPNLPDLRADYVELTGRPPVPPRKAFGLWVSEFGYDNWNQIKNLRNGLRDDRFPFDGFVLDLNWFGGVALGDPTKSRMGSLKWDQDDSDGNGYFFPNPANEIQNLAADHVGLAVIEESYLANTTETFSEMPVELSVYRRTNNECEPSMQTNALMNVEGFWGRGRMIDWSDPLAGQWIHNNRRYPNIVQKGVTVHWTDLGEPESFRGSGCYEGLDAPAGDLKNEHADIHSLYNLLWNKSIWDGYVAKKDLPSALGLVNPRPFILTRSGAGGTQRFGAAMWSGDIASNLESLATHSNAQMHMSLSGIDYYGSDVGGFRREVMPYNNDQGQYRGYENELYTQWFANACWFDTPVRPHTDNEFKQVSPPYQTAPNRVGKLESNLVNIRQRYALAPYYYSLAYRAHLFGEPVVPPLVYYFQNDRNVRGVGHEKMIGRDLLVGIVARHGEYERDVYLPEGEWIDFYSNEWRESSGEVVANVPTYRGGNFRLPAFARAGAILPMMHVDEHTLDIFGHRASGASERNELIVKVFASPTASTFTLYEDDGKTLTYDADDRPSYQHRTTELRQQRTSPNRANVTIDAVANVGGVFSGAVTNRTSVVQLVTKEAVATAVRLNGVVLPQASSAADFEANSAGWFNAGPNLILAKSEAMSVDVAKSFEFDLIPSEAKTSVYFVCDRGFTQLGESVYVVGSIPELGSWNPAQGIRLTPDVYYDYITNPPANHNGPGPTAPIWTGIVEGLPPNTSFEWKCVIRKEDGTGTPVFEPGDNNRFTTTASGYAGRAFGSF